MSRRIRVLSIVAGVLAIVLGANWFAITDHIANLRTSAAHSSGDAVPELLAQAQDFRAAQATFAISTVAFTLVFAALIVSMIVRTRAVRRVAA